MINELLESTSTELSTILYIIASLKVSPLSLNDVQFNLFNIAVTLEYIKKLLQTNLAHFLCTLSIFWTLLSVYGNQTTKDIQKLVLMTLNNIFPLHLIDIVSGYTVKMI